MKIFILFTCLTVTLSSCMMLAVKAIYPGAFDSKKLFNAAERIANQRRYYKIQRNGDTLEATSKEGLQIAKKRYTQANLTDIIECSSKYGIIKWTGKEWVTYFVKGKVNMYYTFERKGTYLENNYHSNGRVTTSHVPDYEFYFFFEKGNSGIMNYTLIEEIREKIKDNPLCLEKLNSLVPAGAVMKESKLKALWEIIELYNK